MLHRMPMPKRARNIARLIKRTASRMRRAFCLVIAQGLCTSLLVLLGLDGLTGIWLGAGLAFLLNAMAILARKFALAILIKIKLVPQRIIPTDITERLLRRYRTLFPQNIVPLQAEDLTLFDGLYGSWARTLQHYDVVIGYGLDGVWPMLAEKHPYIAFEHGTIRSIPFESTSQGRLCALTYRMADGVIITNADNNAAAEKLGIDHYQFIPHPVNEWICPQEDAEELRRQIIGDSDTDFIVFHPSRQHWEERRHPSWEKGNDIFMRGLARFIHEKNPKTKAVFVEWGQTLNQTKSLLVDLGIAEHIHWIPPQGNRMMVRYIRACDLLADQFYLGAFGSTMPKALYHETPSMLYLDEARHNWCFPEMPPVINTKTSEDVFEGLTRLYQDADYRQTLIRDGRRWYDTYHSNEVIADRFVDLFTDLLNDSGTRRAKDS
jgi:glycosyltransferase involved in cell wall biosynthesis